MQLTSQETRLYYNEHATARWIVLWVVCLSAGIMSIALSATMVAVPAIAADLHATAVQASWVPALFLLSNLISLLPSGRLADIYGRKRVFILGNLVFLIGSVLAGFANSIELLLVCRVIQGIGAAMFFSTSLAMVSSVFQDHGRGAAMGWTVTAVYLGLTAGPLIGGFLTQHFGWHSVFLFQVPFAALILMASLAAIKGEWINEKALPIDWLGIGWFSLMMLVLFASVSGLPNPIAIGGLAGVFILGWIFVKHCQTAPYPIMNLKLIWSNRLFSRSLLASMFMYVSNYGLLFLLGLYLQYNRGMTPTQAGQMLMLQALMMAALAPISGKLSDHWQSRILTTTGCLSMALGIALLLTIQTDTSLYLIGTSLGLMGIGFGLFSAPNTSSALGAVPEERLGMASALMNLARLMGQLLGTALVTSLTAIIIGHATITPERFNDLLKVLHWTLIFSLVLVCIAAYFSYQKGADRK